MLNDFLCVYSRNCAFIIFVASQSAFQPLKKKREAMLHDQVHAKSFAITSTSQAKRTDEPEAPLKVKSAWLQENAEITRSQLTDKERLLPPNPSLPKSSSIGAKVKLKDLVSTDHLQLLRKAFEIGGCKGPGSLTLKEFLVFFQKHIHNFFAVVDELHATYMKADSDYDGVIKWDDFCTFCHAEIEPHLEKGATTSPDEYFVFPAESLAVPSSDSINKILYLREGSTITCSSNGVVWVWTHGMHPRRMKKPELGTTGKPMWVTDMVVADALRKVVLSTGDNSIQFYELSNFEPYCQISYLENLPLKLDFWTDPDDSNNCILSFADDKCFVNILLLPNITDDFKMWKKGAKKNNIPTSPLTSIVTVGGPSSTGLQYFRWKLHSSWISQLLYCPEVGCLFSSSGDPEASVVIGTPTGSTFVDASLTDTLGTFEASRRPLALGSGLSRQTSLQSPSTAHLLHSRPPSTAHHSRPPSTAHHSRPPSTGRRTTMFARPNSSFPLRQRGKGEHRVFRMPKGAQSFAYSYVFNLLVTGGMDQVVRAWNPYLTSKPVCCLYGHTSPVQGVFIAEAEERIYSVSFDNCVKVWNLLEYQCLITVIAGMHKVHTGIEVVMYNPLSKTLLFGGDQLHVLRQTSRVLVGEKVHSHDYPVASARFCSVFNQVISVCEGGTMKVWSLETGKIVTEKENLHGNSPITAMILDPAERRAVTGTQNGEIKIWNHNTGQCLKTLKKGNSKEVSELCFVPISSTARYLVCVGWDKQVNVFQDSLDPIQQVVQSDRLWVNESRGVHGEDLTAGAAGGSHFLATASFDGEIVIWSFMSRGIFCRIRPLSMTDNTSSTRPAEGDESVSKIMFLKKRAANRECAYFVVAHLSGSVSFWNVFKSRKPFAVFNATRSRPISTMTSSCDDSLLYVADSLGHIVAYNISDYCIKEPAASSPPAVNKWRAHTVKISCLEYVHSSDLLLSASSDGCIRLWQQHGDYIGTFGQSSKWSLKHLSAVRTPLLPDLGNVTSVEDFPECHVSPPSTTVSADRKEDESSSSPRPVSSSPGQQGLPSVAASRQQSGLVRENSKHFRTSSNENDSDEEETEAKEIVVPKEDSKIGKRLRNYRRRENPQDRGGYPAYYHSLPCYSLTDDQATNFTF